MPKLEDLCQVLIEDLVHAVRPWRGREAIYGLSLALHAVEEDLLSRHPLGEILARYLWKVWEESLDREFPRFSGVFAPGRSQENGAKELLSAPPLSDDDPRLLGLIDEALSASRRLMPTPRPSS